MSLFLVVVAIAVRTTAFLAPKTHSSASTLAKSRSFGSTKNNAASSFVSSSTRLSLSPSFDSDSNDSYVFSKSRTDVRNFLTQRSIQSFVFLLNQCREEHTVRWLEKTLDFTSIDNYHGTGAFNLTKFPEWDSIFLDCVDRPEEVMMIQTRQRRRQRKLSGHNAYIESLKSLANTNEEKAIEDKKPTTTNRSFSTARNYLYSMKPITSPPSTTKKPKAFNITNEKLSGTSNYLDSLSSPPASAFSLTTSLTSSKKIDPIRSNENEPTQKDDLMLVNGGEKSQGGGNVKHSEKPKKKPVQRKTFAPGRSTSYLERLSAISNAVSSGDDSNVVRDEKEKSKQSTELSKNPYLDEKINEIELSIDPPALVRRILSVREQLSKEWVEDLEILIKLNDEIAENFEEYNNKATTKDDEEDDCDEEGNLKIDNIDKKAEDKDHDKNLSDLDLLLKALVAPLDKDSHPRLSSISSNKPFESDAKQDDPDGKKFETVFDRSILNTWSQSLWSPKRSSSPYRKANFDLLLLLATQESIHHILNSYKKDDTIRPETKEWLLNFYTENVNEYFDGHQTCARSEDFLEQMLKSPRTVIETNNDILAWVDPANVAEDVVRERSEVILDWMRVAETILDEHTDLRRLLFTNMVSKSIPDESLSDTILMAVKNDAKEDSSTNSPTEIFGAFE